MSAMPPTQITFRKATDDDVAALRRLVNSAYQPLGEMDLNFTGVTQDEDWLRRRRRGAMARQDLSVRGHREAHLVRMRTGNIAR